jgi:hypothetical protein
VPKQVPQLDERKRCHRRVQTFLRSEVQATWTVSVDWTLSKGMTMKPRNFAVVLGIAAAMTSISSHADDHQKARGHQRIDSGMQPVSVDTTTGQPGHGWRYFVDARKGRAVVISPSGDYFYSRGNGLALVFKATGVA